MNDFIEEYDFRYLDIKCDKVIAYIKKFERYSVRVIDNIDDQTFSEWKYRYYVAGKYILATTTLVNSFRYAKKQNLGIVLPYLGYYSLFTSARVLLLVNPKNEWKAGKLIKHNHAKIANLVCDEIERIDKTIGEKYKQIFARYKDYRELFSYNFALGGFGTVALESIFNEEELIENVSYILEVAQLQSCLFAQRYQAKFPTYHKLLIESFEKGITHQIGDISAFDEQDAFRIGKEFRKPSSLYPLSYAVSVGVLEDFAEGLMLVDQMVDGQFDPDADLDIIFSFD
ncbi:hypothetical protein HMPREF0765_2033 [Sphingobacterium spiritivorum ATCC 33300]|uniref:Uncharacterized protein n=1 Tax=Sphingobacterium spiritivorum ATCC 33300 TaxID=525372 RepID=C2FXH7_SPHSI|nr:hypothetical protein [Sphingobacterium spiritivorum]EEI92418.1 hypothetical protein HMPREF0765_2033 [Sphingobacterium spiritivorum ATCC 33300]QQS96832.1 hypothetical protein I6J03_03715 [Sphingobacterium spiritivorum]